jgi:hypothetical protein
VRTSMRYIRLITAGLAILTAVGHANAQMPSESSARSHGEVSGVVGGSVFIGDGFAGDAMWGLKIGGFNRGRFGVEATFEQSIREPEYRFAMGEFVLQFPKQNRKLPIPFIHVGAGAFLYEGSALGVWSFGGGVKQYINDRVGLRLGVQDRVPFESLEYHKLDFYAGIFFRF